MLRMETETGWWLITHPEHARLAGAFAAQWGNMLFSSPEPRAEVLDAIHAHDDGWLARDAAPEITKQGKPSAFSRELVGKYSAFEEIDLAHYLAVREGAAEKLEARSPYAALLVSMHTYNLLTERADRSTIADLDLLDRFLARQLKRRQHLLRQVREDPRFSEAEVSDENILANFRLLQATDNLSLLACVDYREPATLIHPLATTGGSASTVAVTSGSQRSFVLAPYPFREPELEVSVAARHVAGKHLSNHEELRAEYQASPLMQLKITVTA